MMKNKIIRFAMLALLSIALGWIAITWYVERKGPARHWKIGEGNGNTALVVYDPDPFYNLDEQVCLAFGKALANDSLTVTVATVAAAETLAAEDYSLVVYCANTYNWSPDRAIAEFVEQHAKLHDAPVVAITLGAGSTESSKKKLEQIIINAGGKLLESYSLWLLRPNDETKLEKPNVDVAVAMAWEWGKQVGQQTK